MQSYLVYKSKNRFRAMPMENPEPIVGDNIKEYWLVEAPNRKGALYVVKHTDPNDLITLHLAKLSFNDDVLNEITVDAIETQGESIPGADHVENNL